MRAQEMVAQYVVGTPPLRQSSGLSSDDENAAPGLNFDYNSVSDPETSPESLSFSFLNNYK